MIRSLPIVLCFLAFNSVAEEADIFELSLEQLINMPVAVAATSTKSQSDAPASVSVYDQTHLQQLNRFSLSELAQVTPGFSAYEIYGERVFSTRGQKAGSFENNKHLVLIDGIPVNHARANKAPTAYELPLLFANRVEFMRGPDSALHGVGAFYGVVNIESQSDSQMQQYRLSETQQDVMINSVTNNKGLFGAFHQQQASLEEVGPDFSSQQLYRDQQSSAFLYGKQTLQFDSHEVKLGFMYLSRRTGLGEHWVGAYSMAANDLTWDTLIGFGRFHYELSDSSINGLVMVNQGGETGYWSPFTRDEVTQADGTGPVFHAYKIAVQKSSVQLNWEKSSEQMVWQFGMSADESHNRTPESYLADIIADDVDDANPDTTPYVYFNVATHSLENYALYGNGEMNLDKATLSLGVRLDYGQYQEETFDQISPRISLVYRVSDTSTFKLSYRSALRSPGLKEYSLNAEVKDRLTSLGISDNSIKPLEAETFTNLEANWVLRHKKSLWQFNLFQNTTKHALDGSQLSVTDSTPTTYVFNRFVNSENEITASGAEVEARYYFSHAQQFNMSMAYAKAEDENDKPVIDVPDWTVNLWSVMQFGRWQLTPLLHYQHAYYGASQDGDGITVLDMNAQYSLNRDSIVSVHIQNATDTDNYYSLDGEDRIPLPGRVFSVNFRSNF